MALGLTEGAIRRRASEGSLHRLHATVFAVGHLALTRESRWLAAVLACGPGAVLSHRSAAMLWELIRPRSEPPHVSVARGLRWAVPGIVRHRPRRLDESERVERHGIPVTSVARTLVDLASVSSPPVLARALHQAEVNRLLDVPPLLACLDGARGRRGTARLRALVDEAGRPTKSELERRFAKLLRRHVISPGESNVIIELPGLTTELDVVWWQERLVVELDGRSVHETRLAFETDRIKDAALQRAGFAVLRVTWRRLRDDPDGVVSDVTDLLSRQLGDISSA